jgi:hypothetical protein
MTKNIIDLDLVKIVENELLTEYKKANELYYSHKGLDEEKDLLCDEVLEVEAKINEKFEAFQSLILSLQNSYKKSLIDFYTINAEHDSAYKNHDCIDYKFHLLSDILLSIEDEHGMM